jgi:hypothetical protein
VDGKKVRMGKIINVNNSLVREPVGKRSLSRRREMWEDNFKKNLITRKPSPIKINRESGLGNWLCDVYFIRNTIRFTYTPKFCGFKSCEVTFCDLLYDTGL